MQWAGLHVARLAQETGKGAGVEVRLGLRSRYDISTPNLTAPSVLGSELLSSTYPRPILCFTFTPIPHT